MKNDTKGFSGRRKDAGGEQSTAKSVKTHRLPKSPVGHTLIDFHKQRISGITPYHAALHITNTRLHGAEQNISDLKTRAPHPPILLSTRFNHRHTCSPPRLPLSQGVTPRSRCLQLPRQMSAVAAPHVRACVAISWLLAYPTDLPALAASYEGVRVDWGHVVRHELLCSDLIRCSAGMGGGAAFIQRVAVLEQGIYGFR